MVKVRTIRPRASDSTYIELVRSLFASIIPSVLMSILFIATAVAAADTSPNPWLIAVSIIGSIAALARLAVVSTLRQRITREGLELDSARRAETWFGVAQLGFAAPLGMFAFACLIICAPENHSVIVALIVGYGAGVAAGFSLRPWIAISTILLAVVPSIVASIYIGGAAHWLLAAIMSALMAGGIGSMLGRYHRAVETTELRQMFASLARRDRLTGLANRLGLEERFAEAMAEEDSGRIVLHCLDLDRFKPVNDEHGHLVGDLLLKAVASRLERLIRDGDLAVRLGGDEFAILQVGVQPNDDGELMARRIERAIAAPYVVGTTDLKIGVSVGSAAKDVAGADLNDLLGTADSALYEMKNRGRPKKAIAI